MWMNSWACSSVIVLMCFRNLASVNAQWATVKLYFSPVDLYLVCHQSFVGVGFPFRLKDSWEVSRRAG